MNVNLDEVLGMCQGWDLVLTIGGQDWPVRELTLNDVHRLAEVTADKPDEMIEVVKSLFVSPAPAVEGWTLTTLIVVSTAAVEYFREYVARIGPDTAKRVKAAMGGGKGVTRTSLH